MRTTDQRLAAVHEKVARQRRLRRSYLLGGGVTAAALLLLVGVGIAMPQFIKNMAVNAQGHLDGAASIFFNGSQLGYVILALLAFALGVAVTLLCVALHRKNQQEQEEHHDRAD